MDYLPATSLTDLYEMFTNFEVKADYRVAVFNLYRLCEDYKALGDSSGSSIFDSKDSLTQFLALNEESNGQNVKGDLSTMFSYMWTRQSECYPALKYIKDLENDDYFSKEGMLIGKATSKNVCNLFQKNLVKSDPIVYTILMDEPDQGLDIDNLKDIYGILSYEKPQTQLIAVVYNPVLVYKLSKLPYVNIIEMSPNYLQKLTDFISQ